MPGGDDTYETGTVMIEIVVVILLCVSNSKIAKARGKSGGAAIAYTIGLWFGGEILGAVFGIAASGGEVTPPVYIAALLFAVGGGVASHFIAKSGTVVTQNQPLYPQPNPQQNSPYPLQQPQPIAAAPVSTQVQPLPPQPGQQPIQVPAQPLQAQQQSATATLVFLAKKVMGQLLVSTVTIEVNGVPYQTGFNQPINILAPAGNVQIVCYLNYMGKSGTAQMYVTLAPNQSYQLEYKSPMVITASGTLNITQLSL